MSREVFYNLLKRYLEGQCTEEEQKIVEQWYSMLDDEDLPDIKEAELAEIDEKLWAYVSQELQVREKAGKKKGAVRRLWPAVAVAASLAGLAMAVLFFTGTGRQNPGFVASEEAVPVLQKVNNTTAPLDVWLGDSSHVTLQPGSQLTYPAHFGESNREVILLGEAFFEVTKDRARPFYVYGHNLVTRVVGTSFIVKADEKTDRSEVAVMTGKVVVTHQDDEERLYKKIFSGDKKEVVLTPNHKAVYREQTKSLVVTLVDNPVPVYSENGGEPIDFVFNNSPLSVVLADIERTYGIEIGANKAIAGCTFTGDLAGQDLYTRLEFICQTIGATYTVEGARIYVKGGNCK